MSRQFDCEIKRRRLPVSTGAVKIFCRVSFRECVGEFLFTFANDPLAKTARVQ